MRREMRIQVDGAGQKDIQRLSIENVLKGGRDNRDIE